MLTGKICGIERLRITVDGEGVTSLVGLWGCPLKCKYCINDDLHGYKEFTVEELFNKVSQDALYYEYTGGGLCFGGHEPLLQSKFLVEFMQYIKDRKLPWKFTIETSLNISSVAVNRVKPYIDKWIVDIKDMDGEVYKKYTDKDNSNILKNLPLIKDCNAIIRIPTIPNFKQDIEKSKDILKNMGFKEEQFDLFPYLLQKK